MGRRAGSSTYQAQQQAILDQKNRLLSGLNKLNEAEQAVDVLSRDAEVKKKELMEKQTLVCRGGVGGVGSSFGQKRPEATEAVKSCQSSKNCQKWSKVGRSG